MTTIIPAFVLKTANAPKTGPRSAGSIGYQVLTDASRAELLLTIVSNEGGGYFSREVVPFGKVIESLKGLKADQPFPAKTFKAAFAGKSANNSGFMAAILRAEGLIAAAPEASSQHVRAGDWEKWRTTLLAQKGVPYVPPAVDEKLAGKGGAAETAKPASQTGKDGKPRKEPGHANPSA